MRDGSSIKLLTGELIVSLLCPSGVLQSYKRRKGSSWKKKEETAVPRQLPPRLELQLTRLDERAIGNSHPELAAMVAQR